MLVMMLLFYVKTEIKNTIFVGINPIKGKFTLKLPALTGKFHYTCIIARLHNAFQMFGKFWLTIMASHFGKMTKQ
jgi:hypothetical protein